MERRGVIRKLCTLGEREGSGGACSSSNTNCLNPAAGAVARAPAASWHPTRAVFVTWLMGGFFSAGFGWGPSFDLEISTIKWPAGHLTCQHGRQTCTCIYTCVHMPIFNSYENVSQKTAKIWQSHLADKLYNRRELFLCFNQCICCKHKHALHFGICFVFYPLLQTKQSKAFWRQMHYR